MNYTELSAAIQSYMENTFPDTYLADGSTVSSKTQIDTFIKQAEQRIYNTVQFPSLRKNVTGYLVAANKYLSAPSDFLAVYSIAVIDALGAYEFLLNKDVNFIRQAYPSPTSTGIPKYYALFGPTTTNDAQPLITNELSFILGPTPDAGYSVELHYYYYPTSIVDAADGRTWLGDNFDSVLLYGALVEAAIFMKVDAATEGIVYETKYKEALAQAKRLGDGMERQDAYRSGQYRQAVT
jgi:hypothetical protein